MKIYINLWLTNKIDFIYVVLPIGISFYTFQMISYIIDVYRGQAKVQKNIFKLAMYVSLFPQLIAGPIVRYTTIEEELTPEEYLILLTTLYAENSPLYLTWQSKTLSLKAIISPTLYL